MSDQWYVGVKKRLRVARTDSGLAPRALAEQVGVSVAALYKWENVENCTLPSLDHVVDICRVLNISTDWLLKGGKK